MTFLKMAAAVLFLAVFVATGMYGLTTTLDPCAVPHPRLLLIGSSSSQWSERMIEGARAAADKLGIELDVLAPRSTSFVEQQTALSKRLRQTKYDGIALSPADPESERELINDLANRTKLVTLDRDCEASNRLCHFGYSQFNAGALAARLAAGDMSQPGKVAVLSTMHSDAAASQRVHDRLTGFRRSWVSDDYRVMYGPVVELTIGSTSLSPDPNELAATLADPNLRMIVALDVESAESALTALAKRLAPRRVPVITFDPNDTIFDAIQDGRVSSAVVSDPYQTGFTAIERLGIYRTADKFSLPIPGHGNYFLVNEVVSKENLAEFRRRLRA